MKNPGWYVNGTDKLLEDSIKSMKKFNRKYLRDMGTVFEVEKVFKKIDVNKFSIPELKDMALDTIRRKKLTNPAMSGRIPILCKDGLTRHYQPEQWAETIARTRSRGLQEEGLHNEMARAGFDLVIVSIGGSGDPCKFWEGKILSISGQTPGYQTVQEAQKIHLFHPRCVHSSSPIMATQVEGERTVVWGRDFSKGDLEKRAMKTTGVVKKVAAKKAAKKVAEKVVKKTVTGEDFVREQIKKYKCSDSNDDMTSVGKSFVEQAKALAREEKRVRKGLDKLPYVTNNEIRIKVVEMLGQYRELGGTINIKSGDKKAIDLLLKNLSAYPKDWVNQLKKKGLNRVTYVENTTSLFRPTENLINLGNSLKDSAVHELGHFFDDRLSTKTVKKHVNEFLRTRTIGEAAQHLEGYPDYVIAKKDKFVTGYIGRIYPSNDTEVFSMGMGYLHGATSLSRDTWEWVGWGVDKEMDDLILGILLCK